VSPFSIAELEDFLTLKRQRHDNAEIGRRWRRDAAEVDLALWAMVGRTPSQAVNTLNSRKAA